MKKPNATWLNNEIQKYGLVRCGGGTAITFLKNEQYKKYGNQYGIIFRNAGCIIQ